MPLSKACNVTAYRNNIELLRTEGRPPKEAVAIALSFYRRWCGHWLFVQGWTSPAKIHKLLGRRDIIAAEAPRKDLVFVGKGLPTLKVTRQKDARVPGFAVRLEKDDLDFVQEHLGSRWVPRIINIKFSTGGIERIGTAMVPIATRESSDQKKLSRAFYRNISDFWESGT